MQGKFVPPQPPPPDEFTITMTRAEALALAKLGGNLYHGPHGESFGVFLDERHRRSIAMTASLPGVSEYDVACALKSFYFAYTAAVEKRK